MDENRERGELKEAIGGFALKMVEQSDDVLVGERPELSKGLPVFNTRLFG